MTEAQKTALKIAAALWLVWGAVHLFAGVFSLSGTATELVQNIADAVPEETLEVEYPAATGAVLDQHAWNLAWFGAAAMIGAVMIWRGNRTWIWVTAVIGGLADVGYFIFLDLGDHVNFFPGTLMTLFSGSAILLSGWVWFGTRTPEPVSV
ncbi:MAG: hypothetical protein AAGA99_07160 [Actinomycetota bacterium]